MSAPLMIGGGPCTPPSSLRCAGASSPAPLRSRFRSLIQSYAVVGVLRRHIREDHAVAGLAPFDNFDLVHRAASELHLHADRFSRFANQLEERNGAVLLAERRAAREHNVVKLLDGDRPVD